MEQEISQRIRELRKKKNITLKELGEKTDLSASFLSQVERGVSSMTITTLKKVADTLGAPISDLVDVDKADSFVSLRNAQRLNLQRSYISYLPLGGRFEGRKLEGLILTMKPNCEDQEMMHHAGEEFYYVLSGKATFYVGGEEYEIGEGEVIHYPSSVPHRTVNRQDTELVMLCVSTPAIF